MYVGPLDSPGIANRLLYEAFCIARDDAMCGECATIEVELEAGGRATVVDDGPGLSVAVNSHGISEAEALMTQLYSCRHAKRHAERADALCDLGVTALNALCSTLELTVWRDGFEWHQTYAAGVPTSTFDRRAATVRHGTRMKLALDRTILGPVEFATDMLVEWARANAETLKFVVLDRRTGERVEVRVEA